MLVGQYGGSMKYCFIINPNAGKGQLVENMKQQIEAVCAQKAVDYDIFLSADTDSAKAYIASVSGDLSGDARATFFACGGDGTICKTAIAIMELPAKIREKVAIGVIPMGTGNDFVSNFENKELFFDIDAQLDATPFAVDLLKCNDIYSINMVNIGFDCHVVCTKEKIGKKAWVPRKLAYIFSLVLTLIKKPGVSMGFSADGSESIGKKLLLTTFANGAFCGGGFNSNPTASLTDGKIDCIAVRNVGRIKFLSLVGAYKKGEHLAEKFNKIIDHFKSTDVDMSFDEQTPISVDGEVVYVDKLHISVEDKALTVMLPRGVVAKARETEEIIESPMAECVAQ